MECNNRAHVIHKWLPSHRSAGILIIVLSNMFAVILLKKRAKYVLEFFKTGAKTCSNANFECRSGL